MHRGAWVRTLRSLQSTSRLACSTYADKSTMTSQLAKLTPSQTEMMKKFAVRKPPANAHSISTKGLPVLGLSQTKSSLVRMLTLEALDLYADNS